MTGFATKRLEVAVFCQDMATNALLDELQGILTPAVVEHLPPYFHDLGTRADIQQLLTRLDIESRSLLVRETEQGQLLGMAFLSDSQEPDVQLGYLLGEAWWGAGYASELLQGLIPWCRQQGRWQRILAGVDPDNQASIGLLNKVGFAAQPGHGNATLWYALDISREGIQPV